MEGFQLWLNLPARDKLMPPSYRDIPSASIPEFDTAEGVHVRVIAGSSQGVDGAVRREATQPLYLDVRLPAGGRFAQAIPAGHNAFVYVYRGSVDVAGTAVSDRNMAIVSNDGGDGVVLSAAAEARALIVAGQPLGEPIAQYGPFVMPTAASRCAASPRISASTSPRLPGVPRERVTTSRRSCSIARARSACTGDSAR